MENIPKHIAIIMDGNRRWAKLKGLPGTEGHKEGAKVLEKISRYANKIGIKYMTVYAFSTENWKRAESEVNMLMALFEAYLTNYAKKAQEENIKVNVLGTRKGLSTTLIKCIDNCESLTKNCTGLNFNIAINYGSREEITHAVKQIANKVELKQLQLEDITEDVIGKHLYTSHAPDPDLVIRTSGEQRLSNFLMWQVAYAEFVFIDKNWPEFTEEDLHLAIEEYSKRNRKYGGK